ncbi:hypothetical protein LUZ63_019631 [Rhynchospora breviuscula]|uniref:AAA+ ATPase domain-containing protein n=1 Tax=Rhynchospora breviuscula TaxID=2022672 RepID=A0A9Q0HJ90_9POAL|nr:hypothetical protein LUZ63_019631 [Rhynchospora breviuscula]
MKMRACPLTKSLMLCEFTFPPDFTAPTCKDSSGNWFEGTEFKWQLVVNNRSSFSTNSNNKTKFQQFKMRSFELNFHKRHKEKALNKYLPFILQKVEEITEQERPLKIYMNDWENWLSVDLHHPSTFDTLAIDSELKQTVMDDLARFVKRKDYYKRIGKAWKRGYLLYGPPGTGKSSLVAAMANYLKFDVYDLDLSSLNSNEILKTFLIGMSNCSILLIEDIDCMIKLHKRDSKDYGNGRDKITLSGLLNFADDLWSSGGDERIIVLTTNYKERLDPALTRPGRMDMHIHMGYCGPCGFRVLARNCHSIDDHELFPEIEGLLKEVKVTPAEVAEMLMKSEDRDEVLKGLVEFLKDKKKGAKESQKEGEGKKGAKESQKEGEEEKGAKESQKEVKAKVKVAPAEVADLLVLEENGSRVMT